MLDGGIDGRNWKDEGRVWDRNDEGPQQRDQPVLMKKKVELRPGKSNCSRDHAAPVIKVTITSDVPDSFIDKIERLGTCIDCYYYQAHLVESLR